jgi:hypothetical protein
MLKSSRPLAYPQGLVSAGPTVGSQRLQVGDLIAAHGGLVGGFLVRLKDARVLEDLRSVTSQVA